LKWVRYNGTLPLIILKSSRMRKKCKNNLISQFGHSQIIPFLFLSTTNVSKWIQHKGKKNLKFSIEILLLDLFIN